MNYKKFYFVVLFLSYFLLSNCGTSDCPCEKVFTIRGVVLDEAGNPISGVDVMHVGRYGDILLGVKKTKGDGTYSFSAGPYAGLGNDGRIIFRKEGYQEINQSNPIGRGIGCHDQIIIRDAVMKVAP